MTRSEVHDADGDGAIRLALDYDVPLRSVWVVVDLNTGEYAVAGPSEYAVVTRPLVPGALRRDRDGGVAFLDQNRSRLALLLVRPKRGAWFQLGDITRPASGGDGTADKLTLVFADGKAVGTHRDAAPRQLSARDVLVGIDPGRLDVFIYTAERD